MSRNDVISNIKAVGRELKLYIEFKTKPFNVKDGCYHKEGEFDLVERDKVTAKIEFWRDGTPWEVVFKSYADYERPFPYELGKVIFYDDSREPHVCCGDNYSNGAVSDETLIAWTKQILPFADELQKRNAINRESI